MNHAPLSKAASRPLQHPAARVVPGETAGVAAGQLPAPGAPEHQSWLASLGAGFGRQRLVAIWLGALLAVGVLSAQFSGESTHFFGIADDREQTIRFEDPVVLTAASVVPGQAVTRGALLVEVTRGELAMQRNTVLDNLAELRARDRQERSSMIAEIERLQAEYEAERASINLKISDLEYRRGFNRHYLTELSDGPGGDNTSAGSSNQLAGPGPLDTQIGGLRTRKQALARALAARTNDLQAQLKSTQRPYHAQIAELEGQLAELERQRTQLTVHAQFDGRVGSVLFKPGETIPPYQAVVTVHGTKPTYVQGYIHEKVLNRVQVGDRVQIERLGAIAGASVVDGTVESLGTRIVEYPSRLKRNALSAAWGREVVVSIDDQHTLLLGEKVRITLTTPPPALLRWAERRALSLRQWLPGTSERQAKGASGVTNSRSGSSLGAHGSATVVSVNSRQAS